MDRWCDKYMSTRCAAANSSSVGQLIARQSMPTAYATSGRERSVDGPIRLGEKCELDELGQDSEAGARVLWKAKGTPSGRLTEAASAVMSTLRRSDTGPRLQHFNGC
eukprot:434446-Pleurochrysis_carterae.AAC.1